MHPGDASEATHTARGRTWIEGHRAVCRLQQRAVSSQRTQGPGLQGSDGDLRGHQPAAAVRDAGQLHVLHLRGNRLQQAAAIVVPAWDDELWKHTRKQAPGVIACPGDVGRRAAALWGLEDKCPCSPEAARSTEPHWVLGDY